MSDAFAPLLKGNTKLPVWLNSLLQLPIVSPLVWVLLIILAALIPAKYGQLPKEEEPKEQQRLFPLIDKAQDSFSASSQHENTQTPQPCSTGLTTRLLPFKNANGEIEWAFTDDLPAGSELDAFKATEVMNMKLGKGGDILLPVTSNSSNDDSLLSNKKNTSSLSSPQVNTPSLTASEDDKKDDGENAEGSEHYQCPHCESTFKMRGYLTRHLKKHAAEKAYKCPFHESSIYKDENDIVHKCHPSGGFSRRDTYKTHLKSRHFRYPEGVSIKDRTASPGHCSMCGEWFENGEIWCEIHIEGGECKYLPHGFKGKSRIKNRLKKQFNKMMKEQRQKAKGKGKGKSAGGATMDYQLPVLYTPNSVNTPVPGSASYDYNQSPTLSVSSSIGQQHIPPQSLHDTVYKSTPQPTLVTPQQLEAQDDYDDDFCLDTDQLGVFAHNQFPVFEQVAPSLRAFHSYSKAGVPQYSN